MKFKNGDPVTVTEEGSPVEGVYIGPDYLFPAALGRNADCHVVMLKDEYDFFAIGDISPRGEAAIKQTTTIPAAGRGGLLPPRLSPKLVGGIDPTSAIDLAVGAMKGYDGRPDWRTQRQEARQMDMYIVVDGAKYHVKGPAKWAQTSHMTAFRNGVFAGAKDTSAPPTTFDTELEADAYVEGYEIGESL